jgi:cytoskeletal protein CcmA (bactofilin family)
MGSVGELNTLSEQTGIIVINRDTTLKGSVRNCRQIDIYGFVEGDVSAKMMVVHEGGRFQGQLNAGAAAIHGELVGDVVVEGLMQIFGNGAVHGTVAYGRLAMEPGADLSADVRNVPPRIAGDFEISVQRGRSVRITSADISAIDPDNTAAELSFGVSNPTGGRIVVSGQATMVGATQFTQADLLGGRVLFAHDGSQTSKAGFDVVVTDATGASSGTPQGVTVVVRD